MAAKKPAKGKKKLAKKDMKRTKGGASFTVNSLGTRAPGGGTSAKFYEGSSGPGTFTTPQL